MKTKFTKSISLTLRSAFMLFVLFVCFNASAQIAPASNIRGPLKVKANSGNITITSEISAGANPTINYTLVNNTSGATIVSQGTVVVDSNTGIGVQSIVVNPGTSKGSFNVKLLVTSGGITAESSKSVTVTK